MPQDESRRRRGRDVTISRRRVAATPVAATWIFSGDRLRYRPTRAPTESRCPIELRPLTENECPAEGTVNHFACDDIDLRVDDVCESNRGECGTDKNANTCFYGGKYRDLYLVVEEYVREPTRGAGASVVVFLGGPPASSFGPRTIHAAAHGVAARAPVNIHVARPRALHSSRPRRRCERPS